MVRRRLRALRELLPGGRQTKGRQTNVALLLLAVLAVVTGGLSFAAGTGWGAVATVAHGVAGLALILLSGSKWPIVRRGMRRRPAAATWPSVALGVTAVIAVVSGILHSTGLVLAYGPLDDMQVHVGAGLVALPLTLWHVVARGTVPSRRDLTRRNALRLGVLLGGSLAVLGALEAASGALGLRGARRRFTGSHEVASHDPVRMPDTIWLFDDVPAVDRDRWRLEVVSTGSTRAFGYDDLAGFDDRLSATLDCTGGWYAEQEWHGVRLSRLLDVPQTARSVEVRSTTGYARRFPLRDVPDLLLALRYEGRPLEVRHGAPARLVAPGRRGFWWVKWVERIVVDDLPWWAQPPYPLR